MHIALHRTAFLGVCVMAKVKSPLGRDPYMVVDNPDIARKI